MEEHDEGLFHLWVYNLYIPIGQLIFTHILIYSGNPEDPLKDMLIDLCSQSTVFFSPAAPRHRHGNGMLGTAHTVSLNVPVNV